MPTVSVNLDTNQYVQVNTAFNPMVLQAQNDTVRITLSEAKPAISNTVFHILGGKDTPFKFDSIDTNVWALAITEKSSLIVSETEPYAVALHDADGNQINSLNGAINVHDADVHHAVYNQFLHFDTATVTTLSIAASIEDNQINVVDASAFAVGNEIKIENGGLEPLFFGILAIVANLITLDTPLTFDHIAGSNVTKVFTNIAEAGLTTAASPSNPVIFTSHIPTDVILHIINMSVVMTDTSAMDFTSFGGIAALTNGCVLRAKSDGVTGSYTNWKRNFDLDSDAFPVKYQEKVGGGEFGLAAIYHIKGGTGSVVYIDGSKGDRFELIVQDDLTGLTNFKIKLQGHYEGV